MCLYLLEDGVGIEFLDLGIWPGEGWVWLVFFFNLNTFFPNPYNSNYFP